MITGLQINKLANKNKSIKSVAVENFLLSISNNNSESEALQNLYRDGRLYKWNNPTIEAIKKGIEIHYKTHAKPL